MSSELDTDRQRARVVAEAVRAEAERADVRLPEDLRLWVLAAESTVNGDRPSDSAAETAPDGPDLPQVRPSQDDADAGGLAAVLEAATGRDTRRANGLHVTPGWLADRLIELAFADIEDDPARRTVCDPACGGGAFLVAAARALHARGVARVDVVRHLLWGADIDPVGLATAEAALTLWAGEAPPPGRLVLGDPLMDGASVWPRFLAEGFGAVVGNPPFLNQLGRATVRSREAAERLRRRFGRAVRAYTDTAWLFLLLGVELSRPGGRVTLVQPLSIAGARDAAVVRDALDASAELRQLWVEERSSFAASVQVCAPVLEVTARPSATAQLGLFGAGVPGVVGATNRTATSRAQDGTAVDISPTGGVAGRRWADRLADSLGIPALLDAPPGAGRLGDRARVLGGFRDEYYGLIPLVREANPGVDDTASGRAIAGRPDAGAVAEASLLSLMREADPGLAGAASGLAVTGRPDAGAVDDASVAALVLESDAGLAGAVPEVALIRAVAGRAAELPLVTTGILDWGRSAWGERPSRFAKQGWTRPVVDLDRADPDGDSAPARGAARWLSQVVGVPKVVVATQTRVVEAAVDATGSWVPSVPTLAVLPPRPEDLWRLAAAIAAPSSTVWLFRRAPGTALSRKALKIAARDLADLPLPTPDAAAAWDAAAAALRDYAAAPSSLALDAFTAAAAEAYGSPPALVQWWRDRVPAVP